MIKYVKVSVIMWATDIKNICLIERAKIQKFQFFIC